MKTAFLKDIYFTDKQQFHFQEKVQALTLSILWIYLKNLV